MLPAKAIVQASARWLQLIQQSSVSRAAAVLKSDAAYTDLTLTQYSLGLELLRSLQLIEGAPDGEFDLVPGLRSLPLQESLQTLLERVLEASRPSWLQDADVLVPSAEEIPEDALEIAEALKLNDPVVLSAIQNAHGRIDLEQRRVVGLAGEHALVRALEKRWPGSTTHVAEMSDGFGYDVLFRHEGKEWHLEVKSTGRHGRLIMYLSRHEYEVSLRDPNWRLVVVGLDTELRLCAVATVRGSIFRERCPLDTCRESRWQSTSHELAKADLVRGLAVIKDANFWEVGSHQEGGRQSDNRFLWLPGVEH